MNPSDPNPQYRFLLVAEDNFTSELMDIFIRQNIHLDHEPNHLRAMATIEDTRYHGLLIAVSGSTLSGLELCSLLRAREQRRMDTPAHITLLGETTDLIPILTQGTGADDYLVGAWMDLELEWKMRNAVKALKLLWAGPNSQATHANPDLLNTEGLRAFVFEEVNRIGRRSGSISLSLLWLPDTGGLRSSYGLDWMAWFMTGVWTHIRRQLRNYDRVAVMDNGFVCLISPDLDETGTLALLDRLNTGLRTYHNQTAQHADMPLVLSARYLCAHIANNHKTLNRSAELLWDWICTRSTEPMPQGIAGHCAQVSDIITVTLPQMPDAEYDRY
ncbi:hypothetical protein MASR1M90_16860 [Desulfovibrionales bacterium]